MNDYTRETIKYLKLFYLGMSLMYILLFFGFNIANLKDISYLLLITSILSLMGYLLLVSRRKGKIVWVYNIILLILTMPLSFPFLIRWFNTKIKSNFIKPSVLKLASLPLYFEENGEIDIY